MILIKSNNSQISFRAKAFSLLNFTRWIWRIHSKFFCRAQYNAGLEFSKNILWQLFGDSFSAVRKTKSPKPIGSLHHWFTLIRTIRPPGWSPGKKTVQALVLNRCGRKWTSLAPRTDWLSSMTPPMRSLSNKSGSTRWWTPPSHSSRERWQRNDEPCWTASHYIPYWIDASTRNGWRGSLAIRPNSQSALQRSHHHSFIAPKNHRHA